MTQPETYFLYSIIMCMALLIANVTIELMIDSKYEHISQLIFDKIVAPLSIIAMISVVYFAFKAVVEL